MSIFARQLQDVLKRHGKGFGQLYNIRIEGGGYDGRPFSSEKIKRLRLAVAGNFEGSITLNPTEIEAMRLEFSLTSEEILRLRAALAAESIQRFLADRIKPEQALIVGEALFQLLFDEDDSAFIALRNRMIKYIRGDDPAPDEEADEETTAKQNTLTDLEPAIKAYESALLWLDTACGTQEPASRRGYLAMVASLLTSTQEMLASLPDAVQETPQFAEWQQDVKEAIQEMNKIKG